jgi:hypothetical protein
MGQIVDKTGHQMKNWRWDNAYAFGDQVDHSNPQTTRLLKIKRVTEIGHIEVLGENGRDTARVWKELCYGKADTLADAEEAEKWGQYNVLR